MERRIPIRRARESRSDELTVAVGFSPRYGAIIDRIAERCLKYGELKLSYVAPRHMPVSIHFRGLKPTATLALSLRDFLESFQDSSRIAFS